MEKYYHVPNHQPVSGLEKNHENSKKLLGLWYIERSLGEHRQRLIVGTFSRKTWWAMMGHGTIMAGNTPK